MYTNLNTIKVNYSDFWKGFNPKDDFFYAFLSNYFKFEESRTPDILFYSAFGREHETYDCLKVFYTGENIDPNKEKCDYSFSFLDSTDTNFQLPNFARFESFFEFISKKKLASSRTRVRKFCNFIYTNPRAMERILFCQELMQYKEVDCIGSVLNNTPRIPRTPLWHSENIDILSKYKFTIAFENETEVNYVTEKIFHSFLAGSVPLYWGAPNIAEFFNPNCFINVMDFDSFADAITYIRKVDNSEELFASYFNEFPIHTESKLNNISKENIISFFKKILRDNKITPVDFGAHT